MLLAFVGLTAIDVSLCGPTVAVSQSVLTFAVVWVGVVQIAVPVVTVGPDPNPPPGAGAGALIALCVKSTGCGSPSANATATPAPSMQAATMKSTARGRPPRASTSSLIWLLSGRPGSHQTMPNLR